MSILQVPIIRLTSAARAARDVFSLRRDDVWLATFPKTGSSWLRSIVSFLAHGEAAGLAEVDRAMPAMGAGTLSEPWTSDLPRLIKTHHPYRPGLFARPDRTVLLIRDPRDTLASYHHMLSNRSVARFEGTLSDLVRHPSFGVDAYLRHYASWVPRATTVLRYEDLKADPPAAIAGMLHALDADVDRQRIEEAVERSSLDRMRAREAKGGIANQQWFDEGFEFVRAGDRRADAQRFSDADEAFYQQRRAAADFDLYP